MGLSKRPQINQRVVPLSRLVTGGERSFIQKAADEIKEWIFAEGPEWDGTIPDGQICQREHFLMRISPDMYLRLFDDGMHDNCEQNATLGIGIVSANDEGPIPNDEVLHPLILYFCEKCGEGIRPLANEIYFQVSPKD